MIDPVSRFTVGELPVEVWPSTELIGRAAARKLSAAINLAVEAKGYARFVAATGNSQFPLMRSLLQEDIPWHLVDVFHMDEYIGIGANDTASFRRWIRERIEEPFCPRSVNYINGDAPDVAAEIARYEAALRAAPIDVVCMGIGENGHLAFNEPDVCDFEDPRWVIEIELKEASRLQQVNEGHFDTVEAVPPSAISVTIPALLSASAVIVSAPEARKSDAVVRALEGPLSPSCPASILRQASNALLLLDLDSSSQLAASLVHEP